MRHAGINGRSAALESDAVLVALSFAHAGLLMAASVQSADRAWVVVERQYDRAQLHPPAVFSIARAEPGVFGLPEGAAGIPQSLWRERHLRHHADAIGAFAGPGGVALRQAWSARCGSRWRPGSAFFVAVYLPGYLRWPGLCRAAGPLRARGRHDQSLRPALQLAASSTTAITSSITCGRASTGRSAAARHIGPVRERAAGRRCFGGSTRLIQPRCARTAGAALDAAAALRRRAHERAFRALLPRAAAVRRVTIVGGGLFPRTALVLRRLLPDATLTIVDAQPGNLETARGFVDGARAAAPDCSMPASRPTTPISWSFHCRSSAIAHGSTTIRRRRRSSCTTGSGGRAATGVTVSWMLLKRLNLVRR